MSRNVSITMAKGDGIGPEIMDASLFILREAGAALDIEEIEIGEKVYLRGVNSGIEESSWESLRRTGVFYKAPITTPQGGGFKSMNVTVRKTFGLYANVRPCVSYHPFVATKHPVMDMVIIRENEEDLYAGIEYRQSADVYQCLKLISRPGCEKIIRYAFEYARLNNRKKVAAISKDNIMKMTDGLFHKVFDEIAAEYPEIQNEHYIVDIGAARIADTPERFDVVVTLNLYGDILSDIAAQVAGSVGLAGSSNVGETLSMFEAIHGSAPDISGKGIANPSGLLLGGVMMLNHLGMQETAETVHNAWLKTIEDGIHTGDIARAGLTKEQVGTQAFAEAVVARLGQRPSSLPSVNYVSGAESQKARPAAVRTQTAKKELTGVDIFIDWNAGTAKELGAIVEKLGTGGLRFSIMSNRGLTVYPGGFPETFCTDHWRCRFVSEGNGSQSVEPTEVIALLENFRGAGLDFIKTENLYNFDGAKGYSGT